MKNLKKPTWRQKKRIARTSIDPNSVLVKSDDGTTLVVVDKITNKSLYIVGKVARPAE